VIDIAQAALHVPFPAPISDLLRDLKGLLVVPDCHVKLTQRFVCHAKVPERILFAAPIPDLLRYSRGVLVVVDGLLVLT
jgi:hypothetical protein